MPGYLALAAISLAPSLAAPAWGRRDALTSRVTFTRLAVLRAETCYTAPRSDQPVGGSGQTPGSAETGPKARFAKSAAG